MANVGSGMAGGYDEFGGIGGVWRTEGPGLAGDAGINLAVGRIHGELEDRALRHIWLRRRFRRGIVGGAEDEISIGIWRSIRAVWQIFGFDITRRVGIASGRSRANRVLGRNWRRGRRRLGDCRAGADR